MLNLKPIKILQYKKEKNTHAIKQKLKRVEIFIYAVKTSMEPQNCAVRLCRFSSKMNLNFVPLGNPQQNQGKVAYSCPFLKIFQKIGLMWIKMMAYWQ